METTMTYLEHNFEKALLSYLETQGDENEAHAYRLFLEAFEALKAYETEEASAVPA